MVAALGMAACTENAGPDSDAPQRTYLMGFAASAPRPDLDLIVRGLELWTRRADVAIIHEELPWADLLAGLSPQAILQRDKVDLVGYYRSKGLRLIFIADATDGLARDQDPPHLRAVGRSITEPQIQQLFREYVKAVVTVLHPDYVGLGAETNLVRLTAPAELYRAVVKVANDAAADVRGIDAAVPLLVSVQVDVAWGKVGPVSGFQGIAQDLRDFPFVQLLGLSSYPYFAFGAPEEIPDDYYSRLVQGTSLPVFVTEGGWPSAPAGTVAGSPATQARYLARQARLLDRAHALGVVQLTFTDLDVSSYPPEVDPGGILPLFASLGLVDVALEPKPALAVWDSLFALPRKH